MAKNLSLVTERNRRLATRHRVRLDAELCVSGLPARRCTVLDIGRRGMAVAARHPRMPVDAARRPAVGSEVQIRLPVGDGKRSARASAVVRWSVDEPGGCRFGVFFARCNATVFDLLLANGADIAPRLGASDEHSECDPDEFAPSLPAWFPVFSGSFLPLLFERAQEHLLHSAEGSGNDDECALNAHAAVELWTARDKLHGTVRDSVAARLLERAPDMARTPSLTIGMLATALEDGCQRHFSETAHVEPATRALLACVRISVEPPPARRAPAPPASLATDRGAGDGMPAIPDGDPPSGYPESRARPA